MISDKKLRIFILKSSKMVSMIFEREENLSGIAKVSYLRR